MVIACTPALIAALAEALRRLARPALDRPDRREALSDNLSYARATGEQRDFAL
jgi:hypothetical protein